MSQDAQLAWACPHAVRELMRVPAGSDLTKLQGVVAGPVQIRIGLVPIPPEGRGGSSGSNWPGWACPVGSSQVNWSHWTPRAGQVEIRYVADPAWCPRCQGGLVENDARSYHNAVAFVTGPDLVFQQVAKWSVTHAGSAPLYPWYGTRIHELIGARSIEGATLQVEEEIRASAAGFSKLQSAQARYQGLAQGERFLGIRSLVVTPDEEAQQIGADISLAVSGGGIRRTIQYAGGGARLRFGKLPAAPRGSV